MRSVTDGSRVPRLVLNAICAVASYVAECYARGAASGAPVSATATVSPLLTRTSASPVEPSPPRVAAVAAPKTQRQPAPLGADDFLPAFVFAVIRASPAHPFTLVGKKS